MTQSLQYAFIKTRGRPVYRDGLTIIQLDRIPFRSSPVTIRLLSPPRETPVQGVRLDAGNKGTIRLSDDSLTKILHIWHEHGLPIVLTHDVTCPSGELTVCNIYRIRHRGGFVTEDMWTGNAGLVVLESAPGCRRYGCSDGMGEFNPGDLEFELTWEQ